MGTKTPATKNQNITLKVNENEPESLELIADSIIRLSKAFESINNSSLKRKTIVLLLQDATKLSQRDINLILDSAPRLAEWYTKKKV